LQEIVPVEHPRPARPVASQGWAMTAPAVVIVSLSPEELRTLVREAVRAELAERTPYSSVPSPLVDRRELARLLGVSSATITRMTAEGMPHVFAGASPRYAPDDVRSWLDERGRRGTKATLPKHVTIGGVRLLSRGAR
jgi:predicted DNA-binding transcriptional regulator AlpA